MARRKPDADDKKKARASDRTIAAIAPMKISSGVAFYPPSDRLWRINGEWFDLTPFLSRHPGGEAVLRLPRDRFEDCTTAFEAHHHDYANARRVLAKYRIPGPPPPGAVRRRPRRGESAAAARVRTHHDARLDAGRHPRLLDDDAFYSVLRRRVARYLREEAQCPDGGPTWGCVALFWAVFALWWAAATLAWATGSFAVAAFWGIVSGWLGTFGHNWLHQPRYRGRGWALLSFDLVGFSSEAWFRSHVLQHHMYTNTPWDNHFRGSDPFLKTDPTVARSLFQRRVAPALYPLLLAFGLYVNYAAHTLELARGREALSVGKLFLPLQFAAFCGRWGAGGGAARLFACHGVLSVYYFTLALMNHNAAHTLDVDCRNAARGFGEAQVSSSADWATDAGFLRSLLHLFLNRHTVHHLFPRVDVSHHGALQRILEATAAERGVAYRAGLSWREVHREMVASFAAPRSFMKEILVHGGGR